MWKVTQQFLRVVREDNSIGFHALLVEEFPPEVRICCIIWLFCPGKDFTKLCWWVFFLVWGFFFFFFTGPFSVGLKKIVRSVLVTFWRWSKLLLDHEVNQKTGDFLFREQNYWLLKIKQQIFDLLGECQLLQLHFSSLSAWFGSCHTLFSDDHWKGCVLVYFQPGKICSLQWCVKWYPCLCDCPAVHAVGSQGVQFPRASHSGRSLLQSLRGSDSLSVAAGEDVESLVSPSFSCHGDEFVPPVPPPWVRNVAACVPVSSGNVFYKAGVFARTSTAVYPL